MRRILIEYARTRNAAKRGGLLRKVPLDENLLPISEAQADQLLAMDEALHRLAVHDPRLVKVVELRYFGGLTVEEVSDVLGVSVRTVKRDWNMAKTWLRAEIGEALASDAGELGDH